MSFENYTMAVADFNDQHGHVVTNAMEVYIRQMHQEADAAMAAYREISADAERSAAQDRTLMTTDGLRQSAELLHEAANRTQRALDAWEKLTAELDDGEDEDR